MKIKFLLFIGLSFQFLYCKKEEIKAGITYEHVQQEKPDRLSMHIVTLDLKKVDISLERALGGKMNREEPSSIASRTGAVVACNGANYRRGGRYNGNQLNLCLMYGKVFNDPQFARGVIAWNKAGSVIIEQLKLNWHCKIGSLELPVDRINQPKALHEKILYNSTFNTHTLTDKNSTDIVIKDGKVIALKKGGNAKIPSHGYVYSCDSEDTLLAKITVGAPVSVDFTYNSADTADEMWRSMDFILGGAGLILKHGEVVTNFDQEFTNGKQILHSHDEAAADFHNDQERNWLVNKRHPRTALGIQENGTIVLVVVDGRKPEHSVGMTLPELGAYMKSLGCKDALNLGGGGCSALYIVDKIVNEVSGSEIQGSFSAQERPVSEAFIVMPK
ncbi:MAG: phosphodiester glycosidase family protein [Candidatus Babeliales bacterium]